TCALPISGAEPVVPSFETVRDGSYRPLSRPIFIYVSERSLDRPEVSGFVRFYLEHAAELAREVGYVPLPGQAYRLALANLENRRLGTAFGGRAEVGVDVEELLTRDAKLW